MQRRVRRRTGDHAEHRLAQRTGLDLVLGRLAHVADLQVHAQTQAGERVVAVEHNVLGVDLGDGVDGLGHVFGDGAVGQTFELHAGLDALGEEAARLEADEFGVIVTEGIFGLKRHGGLEAGLLAVERLFDFREQVVTAEEEFERLVQFVDCLALGIIETPGQQNDTGSSDSHRARIIPHAQSMSMNTEEKLVLLGGLSPATFMRRHWQKKPLLVRQALPGIEPPVPRAELARLAAAEGVESRLVTAFDGRWALHHGPIAKLPAWSKPGWTLLVQGLDLHEPTAHALLSRFRFVPEARLDDLMMSYASDGGGVGPHFDSYDVFLIQVAGRRRWRIGAQQDAELRPDVPLKIIGNFRPEAEYVLEPGDMLYLPPGWAHDGEAVGGDCMTCSVGFRAPSRDELARELLQRLADPLDDEEAAAAPKRLYTDKSQVASADPGRIPQALQDFAQAAIARALQAPGAVERVLGEALSEPKPQTWFEPGEPVPPGSGVRLDQRSKMLYDERHVFLNGESYRAGGRDARLMRQLADTRGLPARDCAQLSAGARELLDQWAEDGWVQCDG